MAALDREELSRWIFGADEVRRYTQDSPILPDVWMAYGVPEEDERERVDLLFTPHADSTAARLASDLKRALDNLPDIEGSRREDNRLGYSESYVVAKLSFVELICCALPLTHWWRTSILKDVAREGKRSPESPVRPGELAHFINRHAKDLRALVLPGDEQARDAGGIARLGWLIGIVGRIGERDAELVKGERGSTIVDDDEGARSLVYDRGVEIIARAYVPKTRQGTPIWSVSRNRKAHTALWMSRNAIKADAARRVFDSSCAELRWAVIDSGIDARHPAFRRRDAQGKPAREPFARTARKLGTRVVKSYDFRRLRDISAGRLPAGMDALPAGAEELDRQHIEGRLDKGRMLDWEALAPALEVRYDGDYRATEHEHGTHVAGIIGADWRREDADRAARIVRKAEEDVGEPGRGTHKPEHDLIGVCPDIEIYDLRVLDDQGRGEEFAVTGALQFIRWLNANSDLQVIHGVNLSLSLVHDVCNYAVGRTPVCDECERLVGSGVCVVTVAGNEGRARYTSEKGIVSDGYRAVSITDPGNAQRVITVGSTHRSEPHTYGISYFSSRGPTGDGRMKPDLVAPGEKITSTVPEESYKSKDGTSQAAPHVSGAAALLMARYQELRGQPERIKEILCESATDLGREDSFQGAGMLDVLRAMQAV